MDRLTDVSYYVLNIMIFLIVLEFLTPQSDNNMLIGEAFQDQGPFPTAAASYRYKHDHPILMNQAFAKSNKCPKECERFPKEDPNFCKGGTIVRQGLDSCACPQSPKCDMQKLKCMGPPPPDRCYVLPGKVDPGSNTCMYEKKPCPVIPKRQDGWCKGKVIEIKDGCGCTVKPQCNTDTSKYV